jgi:hypothetical protein
MTKWHYKITTHESDDVVALIQEPVDDIPPMIYCSDQGACYFDEGPNPFTQAMEQLLDEIGEEGWELVQVLFRPMQMIAFWKKPK